MGVGLGMNRALINLLLLLALALLVIGLSQPILSLEKFYIFGNEVSLLSALEQLANQNDWGLFALVGAFSVLFPMIKVSLLIVIANEPAKTAKHAKHLKWLATYSKWSMLDVFVVALLVVSVKLGALAQVNLELGIYAFAASVILTMLVSNWMGTHKG